MLRTGFDWKVFSPAGRMVAACRDAKGAAALAVLYGDGAQVRAPWVVWVQGRNGKDAPEFCRDAGGFPSLAYMVGYMEQTHEVKRAEAARRRLVRAEKNALRRAEEPVR